MSGSCAFVVDLVPKPPAPRVPAKTGTVKPPVTVGPKVTSTTKVRHHPRGWDGDDDGVTQMVSAAGGVLVLVILAVVFIAMLARK